VTTPPCNACDGWGFINIDVVRCASCGKAFPANLEVQDDVCILCGARYCLSGVAYASDVCARYGDETVTGVPVCTACNGTGE